MIQYARQLAKTPCMHSPSSVVSDSRHDINAAQYCLAIPQLLMMCLVVSSASLQTSQVAWVTIPFLCRLVLHWILFGTAAT
jgi:hypothetical protein